MPLLSPFSGLTGWFSLSLGDQNTADRVFISLNALALEQKKHFPYDLAYRTNHVRQHP